MQSFDASWFITNDFGVTSWIYLKWNIYVNWLILWQSWVYITWYNHKLYFAWKIASLNTPCDDQDRRKQVENMFWIADYSSYVSLQNVFKRVCNADWFWTDGTICWQSWDNYTFCSIIVRK